MNRPVHVHPSSHWCALQWDGSQETFLLLGEELNPRPVTRSGPILHVQINGQAVPVPRHYWVVWCPVSMAGMVLTPSAFGRTFSNGKKDWRGKR